jgi:hypothetical protein
VVGYVALSALRKKPLTIKDWEAPLPPPRLALAQIGLSSLDWACAGGVLYVLLPAGHHFSFPYFLGVFLLAQIAGVSSQAPGDLGVFEAVVLVFLTPVLPTPAVLSSLVAYRGIYYLLPLGIAPVMLAAHELLQRREAIGRIAAVAGGWSSVLTPQVLAVSTFEILPIDQVPAILSTLRVVSDAWLEETRTREKRFSLGFFSENYLKEGPIAVWSVKQEKSSPLPTCGWARTKKNSLRISCAIHQMRLRTSWNICFSN